MSKLETPMTLRYWERVGGTLIEEFPAVRRAPGVGPRWIDGIILPNGDKRVVRPGDVPIEGENVIVVQTKASRLGMNVMGQALFSRHLMEDRGAIPIKSVVVCTEDDEVLRPLAEKYGLEVEIDSGSATPFDD